MPSKTAPSARILQPPLRIWLPAGLAALYFWLLFISTFAHIGRIGPNYNAVGTDFMVFHGAARSFFQGHLKSIFDGARFTEYLNRSYAPWLTAKLAFRPWLYPPHYLLLLLPFGLFGFLASYVLFQLTTAAALAAAVIGCSLIEGKSAKTIAACAILCPAAAVNVILGQNTFLTCAILVAGIGMLDRRPILAGAILGLATIKPQFALLTPIALISAREWKAFLAAAASATGLATASALVFGWDTWLVWARQSVTSLATPSRAWIETGKLWDNSIWTCAVLMHAPAGLASALQIIVMLVGAALVIVTFRRSNDPKTRLAILLAATLFVAPHWVASDAVMLTLAGMFWLAKPRDGVPGPYAWILMLALWLAPFLMPVVLVPFGPALLPLLIAAFIVAASPLGGTWPSALGGARRSAVS